jgi:hypothetical protein
MKARPGLAVLLALFLLGGLALSSAAASHSHEAGEVGLYNAECSLALLATLTPSALLVQALSATPLVLLVVTVAPFLVSHRPGGSLSLADVRAPPAR